MASKLSSVCLCSVGAKRFVYRGLLLRNGGVRSGVGIRCGERAMFAFKPAGLCWCWVRAKRFVERVGGV